MECVGETGGTRSRRREKECLGGKAGCGGWEREALGGCLNARWSSLAGTDKGRVVIGGCKLLF